MNMPQILHEDNHVIVTIKPPNIPTQADSSGDTDMLSLIKDYIKEKYNKPGAVYLGMVHRLDRPVGGVMVFAKTSKGAARLCDAFAQHGSLGASKRYVAVVCGKPPVSATLENYIKKDDSTYSAHISNTPIDRYKHASLDFRLIKQIGEIALLDITLHTGRHHQIRAQLAHAGYPIYGDHRYNKAFFDDKNTDIALYAYALEFPHPISHERERYCAMPIGGIWDCFSNELHILRYGAIPIYVDTNIIIIDKNKGIEVAARDVKPDENSLQTMLENAFGTKVFPIHRLDATTSGLVVFARNEAASVELEDAFSRRGNNHVSKFYYTKVLGHPSKSFDTLSAYLLKDEDSARVYIYDMPRGNACQILTRYTVLEKTTVADIKVSALEVELLTGKTHQIRAHLSHVGYPIIGDDKYGNRQINKRLCQTSPMLRAVRLEFAFDKSALLNYLDGNVFSLSNTI